MITAIAFVGLSAAVVIAFVQIDAAFSRLREMRLHLEALRARFEVQEKLADDLERRVSDLDDPSGPHRRI